MPSTLRKVEAGVAAVLTLGVIWLHFMAATSEGALWRDEANTIGLATLPTVGDIWTNLQYDSFPILWVVIVREFAAVVGAMNDPAFRALGFCVGVGVVGVLWLNARAFRHSFPLLSLALLAMSPSLIVWGDSMRAYGFGVLLILLTGALLWRFVDEPDAARFAAAAVAGIASVHALFYNSVLLLAFCAGAVAVCALNRAWKKAGLVVLIGGLAAISIVPYAAMIRNASSWNTLVQISRYDLGWFRERLDETLRPAGTWAVNVWVGLFALAVIVGVRAVLFPRQPGVSQKQREVALFSLVTLVVGVVGIFLFLDKLSYYTNPWYYLALLALAGVCIDALFGAVIHTPTLRIARLAAVLLLAGATWLPAIRAVRKRMTNVDLVASRLHEFAQPRDVVLVNGWYYGVSFARYYRSPAVWMTVPPVGFHRFHRYDIIKKNMMLPDQTMPIRVVTDRAGDALRAGHRVFIVGFLDFPPGIEPPIPLPPAPLPGPDPWPEGAYDRQWSLMVGHFLRQHSSILVEVPVVVPRAVSRYENLQLLVAEGWRP